MQLFIPLVMIQSALPDLQFSSSNHEGLSQLLPASEGGDWARGGSPEESSAGVAALTYKMEDDDWSSDWRVSFTSEMHVVRCRAATDRAGDTQVGWPPLFLNNSSALLFLLFLLLLHIIFCFDSLSVHQLIGVLQP